MPSVEIVEVGPRVGVQSVPAFIPTEKKLRLIRGLTGAGVRRIEIGSFVSPKAIPQLDPGEGVRLMTLVPNFNGARLAAAGVRVFDASVAGLGGFPFAPGATGNVATEDLIYLFHRMGVTTGIELDRYLDACEIATSLPDAVTGGHVRHIPRTRIVSSIGSR